MKNGREKYKSNPLFTPDPNPIKLTLNSQPKSKKVLSKKIIFYLTAIDFEREQTKECELNWIIVMWKKYERNVKEYEFLKWMDYWYLDNDLWQIKGYGRGFSFRLGIS